MMACAGFRSRRCMRGFTMVELMVAVALSLVVALAATASLLIGSRGYSTVDDAAQLRQNASFVVALVGRITAQAGFQDVHYATQPATSADTASAVPAISGFNNATVSSASAAAGAIKINSRNSDTLDVKTWQAGMPGFGSDVLVVRYQAAARDIEDPKSDGSMLDCSGAAPDSASASRDDTSINVFFVAKDVDDERGGEPALSCYSLSADRKTFKRRVSLVRGVENFQVLYGVQAKSPIENTAFVDSKDATPYAYLRADQMVVDNAPDGEATRKNWQLVRSLRIGMILRGSVNKQQAAVEQVLYPLGLAKSSDAGSAGSAFGSSSDPGTIFNAPADGRFRSVETFTIHLRNAQ